MPGECDARIHFEAGFGASLHHSLEHLARNKAK
jgi:hypothetical protein